MNSFDFNTNPFTSKLRNVKPMGHNSWRASCPCGQNHTNGDKDPSLHITYDSNTGRIILYCQRGCLTESILDATGCTWAALFPNTPSNLSYSINAYAKAKNYKSVSDIYSYGNDYYKVRFYDHDGGKTFGWFHRDETRPNGYAWNKQGFKNHLYVSGDLSNDLAYLVEGEKDANTVHLMTGQTAVSAENGAGINGKWLNKYNDELTGKVIYILFDNDSVGAKFAKTAAEQLINKAAAVFLLDITSIWNDCPIKGDITDMVDAIGMDEATKTLQQLISDPIKLDSVESVAKRMDPIISKLEQAEKEHEKTETASAAAADSDTSEPVASLNVMKAVTVEAEEHEKNESATVPPLEIFDSDYFNNTDIVAPEPIIDKIMYPGLGMLGSPAKMGKSFMMLQLVCCVATGKPFMGFAVNRPGSVLYCDLQGTKARTKKRLEIMGYSSMPSGIDIAYGARTTDNGFIQQLEQWILSKENPTLIVVDMLQQVKGSQRRTEDAYQADNRIIAPLHDLALKHNICIFTVMHTRKENKLLTMSSDPFSEILGSTGQFGTADNAWMISGKRNEEEKRFYVICRDNDDGQLDFIAIFKNHMWAVSGTVEEQEEKKLEEAYNNSPITYTIKKLIKDSDGGYWYGTMQDLIQEVLNMTKEMPATTPEKMKKLVSEIEYRLTLENIFIQHPGKNGGRGGRKYKIYEKRPLQMKLDTQQHGTKYMIGNQNAFVSDENDEISNEIAQKLGVSARTVLDDYQFSQGIDAIREQDPTLADEILKGKKKIHKADVMSIATAKDEARAEMIEKLKQDKP